jgi:hypothetical protein
MQFDLLEVLARVKTEFMSMNYFTLDKCSVRGQKILYF